MTSFKCSVCGYVYDPAVGDPDHDIAPETLFENLPNLWRCPICLASKDLFVQVDSQDGDYSEGYAPVKHFLEDEECDRDDEGDDPVVYKERFESLSRVARKITSSLSIGFVLEAIRDQVRTSIPHASEACLLVFDTEALRYTRPLHCAVYKDRINCQLCKRGRETIERAIKEAQAREGKKDAKGCMALRTGKSSNEITEIALPISHGKKLLGALDVIAEEGHGFNRRDILLLEDLATLTTNAIVNARQHWEMAKEKHTLDSILTHLKPFVPETVHRIVEKDPFDPSLGKKNMDVSILFLDIAGYSAMSESLSRDKVTFIIEKYFSSYLDVIYQRGGDINETAGDGLMVIFRGEDPAENALNASRAALDIRSKTLEINKELDGRFEPVDVNMGINSGEASVGMTRFHGTAGTRMTFTATGPVTNLAARIASTATDGDILVGPETAKRIEKEIPLHDRGAKRFKNVKGKHPIFSLVRPE
jgi:class 3 adenylate cyclase/rubredoxin